MFSWHHAREIARSLHFCPHHPKTRSQMTMNSLLPRTRFRDSTMLHSLRQDIWFYVLCVSCLCKHPYLSIPSLLVRNSKVVQELSRSHASVMENTRFERIVCFSELDISMQNPHCVQVLLILEQSQHVVCAHVHDHPHSCHKVWILRVHSESSHISHPHYEIHTAPHESLRRRTHASCVPVRIEESSWSLYL